MTAEAPCLQSSLEDTAGPLEVMPAAVQGAGEEDPPPHHGQGGVAASHSPPWNLAPVSDSLPCH